MGNKKHFLEGKLDYKIYHKYFTDAIEEALAFVKKNGYEVKDEGVLDDVFRAKPGEGIISSFKLRLYEDGKVSGRFVNFQISGLKPHELNIYMS